MEEDKNAPSIIQNKFYGEESVFKPGNLLREARRQKQIKDCKVPEICVLDPDGDLADYLIKSDQARPSQCWACYHSKLYTFSINGTQVGIIPCIVGASYAVLVAEQLFVSGCEFLISITSAGIIREPETSHRFALITHAIRDEGTSYHYMNPDQPAYIPENVISFLNKSKADLWFQGKSWTTDAPYRETSSAIQSMKEGEIHCVEMEASALYAFARTKNKNVACFAHLTNTMAQQEGDFEKGEHFGSIATLELIEEVITLI